MNTGRIQIRRYESQVKTLLDNLTLNPGELSHWLDRDLHVVVHNPLSPADRAAYTAVRDRATAMGLRIYPAFRTQPLTSFQFADYMSTAFWQTNADRLTQLAALRLPGDPWIGIDMENYSADGAEPTASALTGKGYTVAQIRAAMLPFTDALSITNSAIAAYPAGAKPGEDLAYVAEKLGRDRMELWTETTFDDSEDYRRSSALKWPAKAASFLGQLGQIQTRFPGYPVRPGISDLERQWSDPYKHNLQRSGPCAGWGFDHTRNDHNYFGTPEYRLGTRLSSLNNVRHVWPMQPMRGSVPAEFDTSATPVALNAAGGKSTSIAIIGAPPAHPEGIRFVSPELPYTWAGLWGDSVLPSVSSGSFTIDGTLRLPVGPIPSCPLFGAVSYNSGAWQVAYDVTVDKIALYVRIPASGGPKRHVLDMIQGPPRGVDIRLQVGRNGNEWLHQSNRTTLTDDPGALRMLIIGAGQDVAKFPQKNQMVSCPGIVLRNTWSIYDRLLSDPELTELRKSSWPYGYGT